jgi:two-component system OmpR family sensor kinase
MFNSLQSRLWFTYILLIGMMLCIIGGSIFLVVYRGNIPLLQASSALQTLRLAALPRLKMAGDLEAETLQNMLTKNAASLLRGRIVVLTADGEVIADSSDDQNADLPVFDNPPQLTEVGELPRLYRDSEGRSWYYIIDGVNEDQLVFLAVYRPRLQIVSIFRDQYLGPLVRTGLIALLVAFMFSILMSRWISAPLRRISREARQVADGQAHPIPLEGPEEVQQLAVAFNDMAHQVQTSQQSQKDFVANVSHELKTPLTSIQGFSRAILDGTVETKRELTDAAEVIDSEAGRMSRLVQDLLTLAKMDAGTRAFEMTPLNINALLENARRKFTPMAEAAGKTFHTEIPQEPALIYGDSDSLMQVLDNLLDNALKFTPEGGRITLTSSTTPDAVEIHVIDTGEGISPKELERIFERFYQVDKARSGGKFRGYGLGLAISHQIVETHQGTLSVSSQPGEGSHFVVKLPLQK